MAIENMDTVGNEAVLLINALETATGVIGEAQSAIADVTDSTGGTADGTLDDAGASYTQATLNNNFAELATKVNAILAALRAHGLIES